MKIMITEEQKEKALENAIKKIISKSINDIEMGFFYKPIKQLTPKEIAEHNELLKKILK